ncbi:hypothetical protein [Streptomyces natalensis]|nr:hypothetical protein [Streptomyces natalensis]
MTARRKGQRVRITPDGWFIGGILALTVWGTVVLFVVLSATGKLS